MTLFRPMPPIHDESLTALVSRAAATNGYDHAKDILYFANLSMKRVENLSFSDPQIAKQLAWLLGVPVHSIEDRFYRKLRRGTVDFFGTPVREVFIERSIRRVSPVALKQLPYGRAIWHIRTFGFDPDTLDPLLDTCPECQSQLGFSRTQGMDYCDYCIAETPMGFPAPSVDLRKLEQRPYETDDRTALDFVTGLLDPRVSGSEVSVVPDAVGTRNRGELFELAQAIAAALKINAEGNYSQGYFARSEIGAIEPQFLSQAGRAILNYPEGFSEICLTAATGATNRTGEWGLSKAFGAISLLAQDGYLPKIVRKNVSLLMRETLAGCAENAGVVGKGSFRPDKYWPLLELKRAFLVSHPVVAKLAKHPKSKRVFAGTSAKAPILLHRSQSQMTMIQYKDQVPAMAVAWSLGAPPHAVSDLVRRRLNFVYTGASTHITTADTYMSGRSMRLLEERLVGGRKPIKPDPAFCTFAQAMLLFPAGRRPWVPLIERLLDSRIEYVLHKRPGQGILRAISVKGVELVRDLLIEEQAHFPASEFDRLSAGSVNLMLGISAYGVLQALVAAKELVPDGDAKFANDNVISFASMYIFANEIAARGRRPTSLVRSWMEAHEVHPAFDFPTKGGLIYLRDNVEPLLELGSPYAASKIPAVI
ncbi:hypothetical protein [Devosia marina]|uniref:TniQ protein n=1 Tax=Devosia marina TaxID=2683198 RepID=A0A7X3FQE5_9HYPH|nr:hypothetical protein [Devosia marina]MVS98864.1 hypothetical protein [Devosia marina]